MTDTRKPSAESLAAMAHAYRKDPKARELFDKLTKKRKATLPRVAYDEHSKSPPPAMLRDLMLNTICNRVAHRSSVQDHAMRFPFGWRGRMSRTAYEDAIRRVEGNPLAKQQFLGGTWNVPFETPKARVTKRGFAGRVLDYVAGALGLKS